MSDSQPDSAMDKKIPASHAPSSWAEANSHPETATNDPAPGTPPVADEKAQAAAASPQGENTTKRKRWLGRRRKGDDASKVEEDSQVSIAPVDNQPKEVSIASLFRYDHQVTTSE